MAFVRHVVVVSVVGAALGLFGCTSLLGDFQVGAGDDASTAGDASFDATGDTTQPDGPMPGDDGPSTMDGSDGSVDSSPCGANQIQCAGVCVPDTDTRHCGTCAHDCTNLPHVSGAVTCRSGGVCSFVGSSCAPGFADCNTMPDDGCEADLSQAGHCGTCSTMCSGGTPVCAGTAVDGGMLFACASGCPVNTPTLCSGTCVDLNTNAQNCMTCGTQCANVANGQPTCSGGNCGFNCNANYHVCGNGCADNTSVNTCGSSCTACSLPNATPGCNGTACTIGSCTGTFGDCNGTASDGCEVNTSNDVNNCASCGHVCNLANAVSACTSSSCVVSSCTGAFLNCNGVQSDGCETNTNTDINHCGSCANVCNGGKVCVNGNCVCGSGETLCAGVCVDEQTDNNNCGACGQVCTGTTCATGYCTPVVLAQSPQVSAPTDIATDGGYVFWTNYSSSGTVNRVVGSGGGYLQIAGAQNFPQDITALAGWVYFTLENAGAGAKLMRVANNGGSVTTLASAGASGFADGIAIDKVGGNNIYWANNGGGSYTIFLYSLSAGTNSAVRGPIANGNIGGIVADNTTWSYDEPTLSRTIAGQINTVIEQSLNNPTRLAGPAAGYAYYAVHGNGTGNGSIHRGKTDASGFATLASSLQGPSYIATDGVNVYWTDTVEGALYRMPVAGGTPFALARQSGVQALTVDATYVYFLNYSANQVLRVPK
jgi:hypothetical protein